MLFSFIFIYFLVVLWIQDSVGEYLSIRADPTTVSAGGSYTITCRTKYNKVWLVKNRTYIANNVHGEHDCQFAPGVNEQNYRCSTDFDSDHVLKLTVLKAEEYSTTITWSCVASNSQHSVTEYLQITVRKDDSPPMSDETPPMSDETPPMSDEASSSDDTNIMLISVCSAVGIMIMFITMIVGVYFCNKMKENQTEQGSIRPAAKESDVFPADYHNVENQSPLSYVWTVDDEDIGSPYDTVFTEDVPENTNPNFDASLVYGVVSKPGPWTVPETTEFNSNEFYGDAGSRNPNFDPDKLYGVVMKS